MPAPASRRLVLAGSLLAGLAGACSSFAPGPALPLSEEPPPEVDSGIPGGPSLNGCAQASYVDRSEATSDRTLYFGGAGSSDAFTFSPACMVVAAGQTVIFTGDFSAHPLSPGSNPGTLTSGTAGSPIQVHTKNDASYAVTFPSTGTFPFFCQNHYGIGMYGAVRVR